MNKEFLYKFNISVAGKVSIFKYKILFGNSKGYTIEFTDKDGKMKRKFVGKIKDEVFAHDSLEKAVEVYYKKLNDSLIRVKEIKEKLEFRIGICEKHLT